MSRIISGFTAFRRSSVLVLTAGGTRPQAAIIALHVIHKAKDENILSTFDEDSITDLVGTSFNPGNQL